MPNPLEVTHNFVAKPHTTVYAEGASQLSVGFPNSRIVFASHPSEISTDGKEMKHFVAIEVAIPTASLALLAKQIIDSLADSQMDLSEAGAAWSKGLESLLNSVKQANK